MDKGWAKERDELVKELREKGLGSIAEFLEGLKPPSQLDYVVGELREAGLPLTAEWLKEHGVEEDAKGEGPESAPETLRMVFLPEHGEIIQSILAAVKKETLDLDRALEMLKWIELEDGGKPG